MSNKLSQFWVELKRRNVPRVLAIYIASAFMLLELLDIISDPFGLPDWSLKLAFYLLVAGLVVTFILSWMYDVIPGGVEKTPPVGELKEGEEKVFSNSWKIATYVSFVVILGLVVFNVFSRNRISDTLALYGKSIAVLPFINDSPDKENEYFINGTMEGILDNLSKIKELRVSSRTSMEQYRDNPKPIPIIAKERGVSYILEGSMQKVANTIKLTVQLIDSRDSHVWSRSYQRELRNTEDYFILQSEIAELIAGEIEVAIAPEEQRLMEKIPTISLTANDYYLRGRQAIIDRFYHGDTTGLKRAREMFHKALEYDSTFAEAYAGLAEVTYQMWDQHEILAENFMDTVLTLVNIALSYDSEVAGAYHMRGLYYWTKDGLIEEALKDVNMALKINPNNDEYYDTRGWLYEDLGDFPQAVENLEMAIQRNSGSEFPQRLGRLANLYSSTLGLFDVAEFYLRQKLSLDGDSIGYLNTQLWRAFLEEDPDRVISLEKKIQELRPEYKMWSWMAIEVGITDRIIQETVEILESGEEDLESSPYTYFPGYGLLLMGDTAEAEYYFDLQIRNSKEIIALNRFEVAGNTYIDLIKAAAITGKREMALEYLEELADRAISVPKWWIAMIKLDPMIAPIQDEPEYRDIMGIMEAKLRADQEEVMKWLEETGRMDQFKLAD